MSRFKRNTIMQIGLVAGVAVGAIFGQVQYGEPFLGGLVGSGIGPMIGYALMMRFPRES